MGSSSEDLAGSLNFQSGLVPKTVAEDAGMAMDPLTPKGTEIKKAMEKEYGGKKGESVFYASKNKGTISGVDEDMEDAEDCELSKDAMNAEELDKWEKEKENAHNMAPKGAANIGSGRWGGRGSERAGERDIENNKAKA